MNKLPSGDKKRIVEPLSASQHLIKKCPSCSELTSTQTLQYYGMCDGCHDWKNSN